MENFKEKIARVKAFVLDVDGVLTNGGIIPLADGDFIRQYNAKDGYAMGYALRNGYKIIIITGGVGASLSRRFDLLGVTEFHSNIADKLTVLKESLKRLEIEPEEALYMGDDIPDIESMNYVGVSVAPANAVSDVLEIADYVSQFDGGDACARDIIEQVLRARDDWGNDLKGVEFDEYDVGGWTESE